MTWYDRHPVLLFLVVFVLLALVMAAAVLGAMFWIYS